jgi:hypothetical protein
MSQRLGVSELTSARIALFFFAAAALCCFLSTSANATTIVNDSWKDGNNSEPPATLTAPFTTTYSEFGTDQDGDGDIESAWYQSAANVLTTTPNHMTMTNAAGSTSATTYFTPTGSEVNLANKGDQMKITWSFTPTGILSTGSSQGLRLAVVNWPELSGSAGLNRLTGNGAPGTPGAGQTYHGYALFGNMRTGTLGNGNSFQLLKRADTDATPAAFLSASAAWSTSGFTNSTTNNTSTPGYTDGAPLTYVMTFTHNAADGIDVTATMTGTGLGTGNQGFLFQSATDATPNGFLFDTFGLRPSTAADTATTFDNTNFKVEFIPAPEPGSLALLGFGAAAFVLVARRRAV